MSKTASRLAAVFFKEFVQMRRDRTTFAIMIMMPVLQVLLFGYAINNDPRHMPTIVELRDDGPIVRDFLAALKTSTYFDVVAVVHSEAEGDALIRSGRAAFLIIVPDGFERKLIRGERPQILIAADATDPVASSGALAAFDRIASAALARDFTGPLAGLARPPPPYEVVIYRRFNPTGITSHNIVPALLGVILTMTLTMVTGIALTREAERGTLETLLSTPVRPFEVMIGKTVPYIFVALIQVLLVIGAAEFLFHVPFTGSALALSTGIFLFVCVNLLLGFLISTVARSQMQAMQMTFFLFLPSLLLSGFMFPFKAMPVWAQWIGEAVPITHFIRIVRKVMLKDAGFSDIANDIWPLCVILVVIGVLAMLRYRRTLD